ncbi:fatty acyl-CoA reductase 3-like [Dendrobium catenatum]|uniref:fatty acyl-CoA reductase 3-like n=1 Tax=Dendrobium catenatum TaxID=906689 RepID=UPI00109F19C9|nr:fatty acyl-CoA reductase 3-like [Dendrobium catenatum]
MEIGSIVEYFKDKSIFVTGAIGFLAKIFVERVLRVQPNVKKLFLLVRTGDAKLATERMQNEVFAKELFDVLKEKHGPDIDSFISKMVYSVAGDIIYENLGIEDYNLRERLWEEIDIVVNVAGSANFYERYDVSLYINTLGAKQVLEFAKQCTKVHMLLHVSTAYVAGTKEGIISEKPFHFGKALNKDLYLDIEGELRHVEYMKKELHEQHSTLEAEKIAMKELGIQRARMYGWPNTYVFTKAMGEMLLGHLRGEKPLVIMHPTIITSVYKDSLPGWIEGVRTIDSVILGYAKGDILCILGDLEVVTDLIPGDMVVNAMILALATHSNQHSEVIYHGLCLINLALFGLFTQQFNTYWKKYKLVVHLADIYAPYTFFKGSFDDSNLESLRKAMENNDEMKLFDCDPKHI